MNFALEEAFALLAHLVAIRSYPGEEYAVQEAVADWFRQQGLTPEWQPTPGGAPNLLVTVENGAGPTVLLNGHVDTVLAAQNWSCDPWQGRRDGDRFYGLGAGDMKCGVVANMLMTRVLAQHRERWCGRLIFSSVIGEEAYSAGARALIEHLRNTETRIDACMVTEPWHEAVCIGGAGKVLVNVAVTGKAAHGFFPKQGVNAAIEAARFAAQVCEAVPELQHDKIPSSQTILSFLSGSERYVVTLPEQATVLFSRQIVPGETGEQVLEKLRAFAASLQSPARFDFTLAPPYYPPWEFDPASHVLGNVFTAAYAEQMGRQPDYIYSEGVSDANLFSSELGAPTIVFGPHGGNWHQCDEWVDLPSIVRCAEVMTGVVCRLGNL
jgi:acetylornithine deacetylase/succinyl-diaminopimelate desuccinylase-like protein